MSVEIPFVSGWRKNKMFSRKKQTKQETSEQIKKKPAKEAAEIKKESEGSSPLLERYLQKTMTDQMQNVDDEVLAKAIQTLLYKDKEKKKNKHLN